MPLVLALNNVRSLHNVGAIFRAADGTGIERLILGGLTPAPPRHEIDKTALGTVATVPWEYARDLGSRLKELGRAGYVLAALEQTPRAEDLFAASLPDRLVLAIGHEREGVEPEILALCQYHLAIPMRGRGARSLNVATAAAIAAYRLSGPPCYDKKEI